MSCEGVTWLSGRLRFPPVVVQIDGKSSTPREETSLTCATGRIGRTRHFRFEPPSDHSRIVDNTEVITDTAWPCNQIAFAGRRVATTSAAPRVFRQATRSSYAWIASRLLVNQVCGLLLVCQPSSDFLHS